ncbi:uncharacterized protein LOC117628684 [Prunus dulcis]|uniref:uncharacterized protein LOC117628684 n=1 Tax=Prunus dulcis TaxID=3755 RepID=UPI001482FDD4|nr:uncharacterized protein LOC117628684 [Prunus dulcis]XP_034217072.1 uncharacterized protein LOC117628684 [Prunus dulcis]
MPSPVANHLRLSLANIHHQSVKFSQILRRAKRTRIDTIEASSSRPDRQRPTASTRRQGAGPQDHFEDTIEVEDVAPTHDSNVDAEVEDVVATHDSNVEVHVEPTEPSRVGHIDPSLLTSFKTHIAVATHDSNTYLFEIVNPRCIHVFVHAAINSP